MIKKLAAAAPLAILALAACGPANPVSAGSSPAPASLASAPAASVTPAVPLPATTTAVPGPQCHFRYDNGSPLPDPKCTPGTVLTTSAASVCTPGWASAHREYFTKAQREAAFAKYGVITVNPAGYGEYDHLISLELGGSNSPSNLWPEQGNIPNAKDAVENALHDAVCSGRASLAAAQRAIAHDWTTAEKVIGAASPAPKPVTTTTARPEQAPASKAVPVTTTAAPVSCSPVTSGGNCYKPGEFCPKADRGDSGTAGNGEAITCDDNGGWRWEAA